jgi:hypothetical protein
MAWSTVWTLPDPRDNSSIQIAVTEADLKHASDRHFLTLHEPWVDYFTAPLLDRLRACWQQGAGERAVVLADVAARLEASLRSGLERPQVCQYMQLDQDRYECYQTWEVVTKAGFLVIIRHLGDGGLLKTAFYPLPVCTIKASKRWVDTGKWVVRDKYPWRDETGRLVLPPPEAEFPSYEGGELIGFRVDLTYITPEVWGFRDGVWGGGPLPWP